MRLDVSGLPVGSEQTRQAGLVVGGGSKERIARGGGGGSCLWALMERRSPNARSAFSDFGPGPNRREWSVRSSNAAPLNFVFASEKQPRQRLFYLHLRPSVKMSCPEPRHSAGIRTSWRGGRPPKTFRKVEAQQRALLTPLPTEWRLSWSTTVVWVS